MVELYQPMVLGWLCVEAHDYYKYTRGGWVSLPPLWNLFYWDCYVYEWNRTSSGHLV